MNPIVFSFGPITIYWYSLCILIAFILGFQLAKWEIKKHIEISNEFLYNYFFYLIPIVIFGARLYYCIFEWKYYIGNPIEIIEIWSGGLAIHGGIIAGIIYTIFYTKKKNINCFKFFDIAIPSLVIGQAIGRWGNFFNQEAYGPIIDLNMLKQMHLPNFVIEGMFIDGAYHHPTFLYESITCLICFIFLMLLKRFYKNLKVGTLCGIYFIIYGVERFFVEKLRQDSLMLCGIKVAQLVSVIMIVAGLVFLVISHIKNIKFYDNRKKENDD